MQAWCRYSCFLPSDWIVGGLGGFNPQFIFQPPSLSWKITMGDQAKPPRAAFNSLMYLALCLHQKISNTCELQDDPIIRGYDSLVDYLLIYLDQSMAHIPIFYFCTCRPMPYTPICICVFTVGPRDQKLKRCGMLYRVAHNKWDLLKLCMSYF